jgi:RNA-directed DNA polymerase
LLLGNRHGPRWIMEGDIKACFDRIDHHGMLRHVPLDKDMLRKRAHPRFSLLMKYSLS